MLSTVFSFDIIDTRNEVKRYDKDIKYKTISNKRARKTYV